ncbi:ATP-binding protein [Mycolicibacterium baixiangningiae]|uniref:ATP-binding protein n=1 Tax=Mycolicibacterium baixiangningiae TaxID=2761578 RepID=UPI001867D3C4|nr:LuxR family transcriptional regulator [Mycolicibacterium baixiangningiae]
MSAQPELLGRHREQETLSRLIDGARQSRSGALVIRGEAGIGKTALLTSALTRATHMRHLCVSGVEYESELAYSGVQQVCQPLTGQFGDLLPPQRDALLVVLGLSDGDAPDRFRVALAVLTLLGEAARTTPIVCAIDDAQWLDKASLQVFGFVARRLAADPVVMIFAARPFDSDSELAGLPEMWLERLDDRAARALLARSLPGRVDERTQAGILAEAAGNPLALLELHRVLTPAELAGGYGWAKARLPAERVESVYSRLLPGLPEPTRTLLLIAASEPAGQPMDVWATAALLGVGVDAAGPAEEAGLLTIGRRIQFRHPLVRSAIYQSASQDERRSVHRALAEVMVGRGEESRRAWHRAHAAAEPDESVAHDLEASADQARARGGAAAAAAFLSAAAELSPDRAECGRRAVAAARDMLDAGAPDAALQLLAHAESAADLDGIHVEVLRSEIAFATRRGGDAPIHLLACAERLAPVDVALSRQTYLKAMMASIFSARLSGADAADPAAIATACAAAPAPTAAPGAADLLLTGLVKRFTAGYGEAAPVLRRALRVFRDEAAAGTADAQWYGLAGRVALDLWEQADWAAIAQQQIDLLRRGGVLTLLPVALAHRAGVSVHSGRFAEADGFIEEAQAISAAIGVPSPGYIEPVLAAFRGQPERTMELVDAGIASATARGEGRVIPLVGYAAGVLHNTFGDYGAALAATKWAVDYDDLGMCGYGLLERVEAGALGGDTAAAHQALDQLLERTAATGTEMALGMAARSQALLANDGCAEELFIASITHLKRCDVDVLLARVHLLYGEWLRDRGRQDAAATQLRRAHGIFSRMRADGFAGRARRGLSDLGQAMPVPDTGLADELSRQELTIARMARSGQTNTEIAAQLFISPRTVEWHMTRIFGKLSITSRHGLRAALTDTA